MPPFKPPQNPFNPHDPNLLPNWMEKISKAKAELDRVNREAKIPQRRKSLSELIEEFGRKPKR